MHIDDWEYRSPADISKERAERWTESGGFWGFVGSLGGVGTCAEVDFSEDNLDTYRPVHANGDPCQWCEFEEATLRVGEVRWGLLDGVKLDVVDAGADESGNITLTISGPKFGTARFTQMATGRWYWVHTTVFHLYMPPQSLPAAIAAMMRAVGPKVKGDSE